jgi:hypothetical protein
MIDLKLDDCLNVMRGMADDSVDAIVTDPPGGIHFMGKSWDHNKGSRDAWIEWLAIRMTEALRVTKPGARALVWAIPRTSHWTGMAIEDAGWIIEDRVAHLFGQGYPKAKSKLKPACEDWWLARKPSKNVPPLNIDDCRIGDSKQVPASLSNVTGLTGYGERSGRTGRNLTDDGHNPNVGRWPANVALSHHPDCKPCGTKRIKGSHQKGSCKVDRPCDWGYSGGERASTFIDGRTDIDGMETVESWDCVDFIGDIFCYEHRNGVFDPLASPESLVDLLPSLIRDVSDCSTMHTILLPDASEFYRIEGRRLGVSSGDPIDEVVRVLACEGVPGFRVGCPSCLHFCGGLLRGILEGAQGGIPSLVDVLDRVHLVLSQPGHNPPSRCPGPPSSSDDSPRSNVGDSTLPNRIDDNDPFASLPERGHRTEDRRRSGQPPNVKHDSTSESRTAAIDNPGIQSCNACRPAVARTLCMLSADLAWRFILPAMIIRRNEIHVNIKCPVAILDEQGGNRCSAYPNNDAAARNYAGSKVSLETQMIYNDGVGRIAGLSYSDSGGASRFFYCSKASPKDRGEGNTHPTVKSTDLLSWLIRLISDPGDTILDPFAGSGSTGLACLNTGRSFIGIESDPAYFAIAQRRLAAASNQTPLFAG